MQVEWAKSHTHAQQWSEEVVLVIEEMRWVIQHLDWKASWWQSQGPLRSSVAWPDIISGLNAYAEHQADLMINIAMSFASFWHPLLVSSQLPIDWPSQYIEHAYTHPTICQAARHIKKFKSASKPALCGEGDDDSSGNKSNENLDNISDDDDDLDASPYQ